MTIELRPLTAADAAAHCAGEDELTVRWLTGGYGDVQGTITYFEWLEGNADAGAGKRGFGAWTSGRLCGYIDYDPDLDDGIGPDDVSLSYAVHPWARGRGVAVEAVQLTSTGLVRPMGECRDRSDGLPAPCLELSEFPQVQAQRRLGPVDLCVPRRDEVANEGEAGLLRHTDRRRVLGLRADRRTFLDLVRAQDVTRRS